MLAAVRDSTLVGVRDRLVSRGFRCGPVYNGSKQKPGQGYYNITVPPAFPASYYLVGRRNKGSNANNQEVLRSKTQLVQYLEACLVIARTGGVYRTQAAREAEWREACERRDEEHEALQQSRDELQARFDWLATRWRAREPRPIDVEVVGALKAELERQLRVTDHAVRQSRAFEEKLGQLDSSYVMFGKEGTRVRVERGPTPGDRSGGR